MLMHPAALLLHLLLPSAVQERDIQVSGHAGWGGLAARGDWAPVLVDVDNRGEKDRDLQLVLTWAPAGSSQQSAAPSLGGLHDRSGPTHVVPVTVGARARKRISLAMLAPEQERSSVWVYAFPSAGGKTLSMAELQTRPVEPGHRFVAVVGRDLPDGLPAASNAVARLQPEALPEDWRGYASLDALIWLDGRPSEIRSQVQVDALRTWISTGGRLVVARATEAGIPGSALAEILPVSPKGTIPLDGLELFGRKAEGRVAALEAAVRRGKVLARQGAVPLVVESAIDAGHATFVAFDPSARPFAGWEGAPGFWDAVLGKPRPSSRPNEVQTARVLGSDGLAQVARRFPDVEPPAIGWLFVLILAYLVVVGPFDYFVLRAFRRLELTWITFPAYVVGFTLFILVAGGAFMSRAAYQREIAVLDHFADSDFTRRRAIGALLAPTDIVYSLRDAEPLSSNFTSQSFAVNMAEKLHEARILHGKETIARDWVLNRSATGLALGDRCSRSPAPLSWTLEGDARITVRNTGPAAYDDAALVTPKGVFVLGALPSGTRTIEAARRHESAARYAAAEGGDQRAREDYYYRDGRIGEPDLNAQVRSQFVFLSFGDLPSTPTGFARSLDARRFVEAGGSVLVAWSTSSDPEIRFDPFPSRRSGFQMTRVFAGPER